MLTLLLTGIWSGGVPFMGGLKLSLAFFCSFMLQENWLGEEIVKGVVLKLAKYLVSSSEFVSIYV